MRGIRLLCALVAVSLAAGVVLGQAAGRGRRRPARRAQAKRRVRVSIGAPFSRIKGLSAEQKEKLAALWAETRERLAAAAEAEKKALKTYLERGEKVLNDAQRKALAELRAKREARRKAARGRKPAKPAGKPKPVLRGVRGPVTQLKDLTEDQVKKINELAAKRAEATRAAYEAMRKAVAQADKEFQAGLERVLNQRQKAALKALIARAKAQREAAAKRAAEERRRRTFGGDFRLLKGLSDEQKLALGQLWREAQEAVAAAKKAAETARADYLAKGRKLLTREQLKALEEFQQKAKARRSRRGAKKAA